MLSPQTSHPPKSVKTVSSRLLLFGLFLALAAGTPSPAAAATTQLECSSSPLKFGWVAVGSSESQLVVLTNTGSSSVTISGAGITGTEFKVSGGGFPKSLGAGKSMTVNVTFAPSAPGWVSRLVTFHSNAANPNLPLSVRGTAVAKEPVLASPASLSFGQVPVGSTGKLTVNLTNNCKCSRTLSAADIMDSAFAVTNPKLPLTLNGGQTVAMTITFTPRAAGTAVGSVMVEGPYLNIPLNGTGTAITGATLIVNPGTLNFGSVALGATGTEKSQLSAIGGNVTVTSAASSNGQFAISGISLPVTIPAGQSVSFGVVFTPKNTGTASANLTFVSSISTSKTVEALTATATTPFISLSWSASTSQVAGYNVYRSTSTSGPFSRLNSKLDSNTSYVDNSVSVGATYFYATTAVNSSGQESGYSNLAEVEIP